MVLKQLSENEAIVWAKQTFIKWGLGFFIVVGLALLLNKTIGFTFDIDIGLGL
jgi:hypothetical protein